MSFSEEHFSTSRIFVLSKNKVCFNYNITDLYYIAVERPPLRGKRKI
jgi:hypothetical protein